LRIFRGLFFKISLVLLLLTGIAGTVYVYITVNAAEEYFQEKKQKVNRRVAYELLNEVQIFVGDSLNTASVKKIMMYHMKSNPTAEVYIVDNNGKILTYDAPPEKIKLQEIEILPLRDFIAARGEAFLLGEDPRNPGVFKVFSAAPIYDKREVLRGYVYIILSSEEYDEVRDVLRGDFIFQVGIKAFLIALFFTLVIGLIAIWFLTRNLQKIQDGIKAFSKGDYSQRITLNGKDEFTDLAITFNKMAEQLEQNIDKIESVEKLRKELIGNVSHDLRTPIAVLHGYLETILMKKDTIQPDQLEAFLKTAMNSANKLEELIKDLFELTKLESTDIHLNLQSVNLFELLNDLKSRAQIIANRKSISIKTSGVREAKVQCDYSLMERALQNLIENAIKFSPENSEVELNIEEETNHFRLKITDQGEGISEGYLPYIFNRYKKLHEEQSDNSGAGLGLAIVKRVIELHAFTIAVESEKGVGTLFIISIPKS
jgi:signal transduction histidine kinase